jgi:HlyD family secretion protein
MSMVIPVDELDIPNVFVGQEASVRVEALPGRVFSAKVSKIAAEGTVRDGIATYDVTLALEDTTSLRGSMTANATIVIQSKPNALLVPSEAVRSVTTGVTRVQGAATPRRVTVLNDGVPEQREVMVGLSNGVFTEILSGLEEGDVVVISVIDQGSQTQTPLMPVTPSQPGSGGGGRQGGGRGY